MIDERNAQLVMRLHKNTRNKKILWEDTPTNQAFVAAFPKYSVQIERKLRRDAVDYVITIINDVGVPVDDFSDVDLSTRFDNIAPERGWFEFMNEIYEMARRQALGADEAIDAILGELE
jgi:hypothetical protein